MVHVLFDPSDVCIEDMCQIGGGYFAGYSFQRGGGLQHGAGVGDILKRLWRFVLPLAARAAKAAAPVAKEIGKEGLLTSSRILANVADGADFRESLIAEGKQGVHNVIGKIQKGSGKHKRKRPASGVILHPCDSIGRSCVSTALLKKKRKDILDNEL